MQNDSVGKIADLGIALPNGRIRCTACARYCEIPEGKIGLCGVRGVVNNNLRLFVYGRVIAGNIDPIEKKPVTHYQPGSSIYSISTTGCNWLCHPAGTKILLANSTQKKIENLVSGDSLWSYDIENGFKSIPSVITHVETRHAEIYEVCYGKEDGRFSATIEHPVLTQRGWIQVGHLRRGDRILHVRDCEVQTRDIKRNLVNYPGKGIEFTIKDTTSTAMNTVQLISMNNRIVKYYDNCNRGNHYILDENVGSSRHWHDLNPLNDSRKLLYCILEDIGVEYLPSHRMNIDGQNKSENSKSCYIFDAVLPESNFVIQVDDQSKNLVRKSNRCKQMNPRLIRTLEQSGWQVLTLSENYLYYHREEVKALIMQRLHPITRSSNYDWLEVKSIKPTGRFELVYSLECIPNHNYVADEVLVHNCQYCQNYDISQRRKVEGTEVTPQQVVDAAERCGAQGIAYTYNEPSIFMEFARDCGIAAHKRDIFNIFVSNGYDTPESVNEMSKFLDCITVDFKGSGKQEFVRRYIGIPSADPIFATLKDLKHNTKIHIEITDLIVPKVGDDLAQARKLCKFVYDELGPETPIHFLRFHPDYKMMDFESTPISTLEKHYEIAKAEGLDFAYVGNVPGHKLEDTYCPGCNSVAIGRYGFYVDAWNLDSNNKCATCGYPIPVLGRLHKQKRRFQFI